MPTPKLPGLKATVQPVVKRVSPPRVPTPSTPSPPPVPPATAPLAPLLSARPVLELAGQAMPGLSAAMVAFRIDHALNQPAVLDLQLDLLQAQAALGVDGAALLWQRLAVGQALVLGADAQPGPRLFSGRVVAVGLEQPDGQPPQLRLVAADLLQTLATPLRRRSLPMATAAARVRMLATAHGLKAGVDWRGTAQPALVQLDESDLALLQRLAAAGGRRVWCDGQALRVGPPQATTATGLPLLVMGRNLRSVSALSDSRAPAGRQLGARASVQGFLPGLVPGDAVQLAGLPHPFNTAASVAAVCAQFSLQLGPLTILDLQAAQLLPA